VGCAWGLRGPRGWTSIPIIVNTLARLRRKLEADPAHPRHLLTGPGLGYRFRP